MTAWNVITDMRPRAALSLTCVIFTALTLVSTTLALTRGEQMETHLHLLARLAFTIVGVGAFYIFAVCRRRFALSVPAGMALAYVVAMGTVLGMTWAFGRAEPLHPDAYCDAFLNFTTVGIVLTVVLIAVGSVRKGRRRGSGDDQREGTSSSPSRQHAWL